MGVQAHTGPDSFVTLQLPENSLSLLFSNSTVQLVQFTKRVVNSAVLFNLEADDVESRIPTYAPPPAQNTYGVRI